ncbi:secretion system protein D [Legionella gratiana]|uniref:Membrane fusion protein (MFP) family protein n=1 Tax=Legionella gratiana TaxID=45066 RepID=A0A378J2S2_9GAMM|nr:HlyD family type I secretion periplasmic adaptor subunit [Legionella gratiana]KTD14484.1 secretion system protein D [Legionella gratiana]STX42042.1 HlyD family secretion protein [Legionella gratiana]
MTDKKQSHLTAHLILIVSVLFLVFILIWANFAILDEVTVGEGKVIPSSQIQIVQNLEGGIVEKIFVHEGETVNKNQILMKINDIRFTSSYNTSLKKISALQLEIARIMAQINNQPFVEPKDLKIDDLTYTSQKALYDSKSEELKQLNSQLEVAEHELSLTKPLVAKGAASKVEVLQLERSINEIRGKISNFKSTLLERLNTAKSELAALLAADDADKDRVTRTTVRSPVKGIVKKIKINTIGGVIQPGVDILEIVPLEDTLLIEAKIKPKDIGFIHPGQNATVKITAYDYSIYGGLPGKVEQISADSIVDEKNNKEESYYLIRVRTTKNYLGSKEKPLYIIPGMMATVDILTGKKTVMEYLLKPILKAKHTGLRER